MRSVIVSQNHYLNKILNVHPLKTVFMLKPLERLREGSISAWLREDWGRQQTDNGLNFFFVMTPPEHSSLAPPSSPNLESVCWGVWARARAGVRGEQANWSDCPLHGLTTNIFSPLLATYFSSSCSWIFSCSCSLLLLLLIFWLKLFLFAVFQSNITCWLVHKGLYSALVCERCGEDFVCGTSYRISAEWRRGFCTGALLAVFLSFPSLFF
jgi:hypothetical protein